MFQFLEAYTVPLFVLLIQILAALVLLNGYVRMYRRKKHWKKQRQGEAIYKEAVSRGEKQVHLLVRLADDDMVFATENIDALFGISAEVVRSNRKILQKVMGYKATRQLYEKYVQWDGKNTLSMEFEREGYKQWIRVAVTRVLDHRYDFVVFEDITEQKQEMLTLQHQLEMVEEESQSKTVFLSRMSHEIRTPMNGIIGMITLTQKNMQPDAQVQEYLNKAGELSQYLLSLINDILDMSRIEAGKIELAEDVIDLNHIAEQLIDMFKNNVEESGVRFFVEMQEFTVRYVVGDELRLMQVIVNFLSNAVKFTKQGEIGVIFRQMYYQDDMVDIMIRVHDTGKGMKPEFVNRIFKPFEQEDNTIVREYGGTGLGMTITDQIVQLMGGQIVIDSLPGKGSDFTIYLKMPVAKEPVVTVQPVESDEEISDISLQGLHVLLAEDNDINAEIAVNILGMDGIQIQRVENGRLAVEAFQNSEPGYFDIILMDIQMPEMNGIEAAKAIRALAREDAKQVGMIALSADAFVEDQRRTMAAGMDLHMAKPIDFDELKQAMAKLLHDKRKEMSGHER